MHGQIPDTLPEGDILLIAGDICPGGRDPITSLSWFENVFNKWIAGLQYDKIILTPGNHDLAFEAFSHVNVNCDVLIDEFIIYKGFKIYGSPWQITFLRWAFNLDESDLSRKWGFIPDDTDILLTHCPPFGVLDTTKTEMKSIGSPSLYCEIMKKSIPLCVFGHNHQGYGHKKIDDTVFINTSLLDEDYKMVNFPYIIDVERKKSKIIVKTKNELWYQ